MRGEIPTNDPKIMDIGMNYPFSVIKAFCSQRGDDRGVTATGNWFTDPLDFIDNVNSWEMLLAEEGIAYQLETQETAEKNKLLK